MLLTASGITRLLDGLERAGWVAKRRCDTDARVTYAVLTDEGVEKFEAAYESHAADIEELFGRQLSDEERRHFGDLLEKLPMSDTACADD